MISENYLLTHQAKSALDKMNNFGKEQTPFFFIIDFEMLKPIVLNLGEVKSLGIRFSIGNNQSESRSVDIQLNKFPPPFEEYQKAFDEVSKEIQLGNTYLLNLTVPTKIEIDKTLKEIYDLSSARYKLLFQNNFVVFSPETFVKINEGIISSYPMKGTIDASIQNAEKIILSDEKEIAEHNTIVDLIRNDLSIVATKVSVEKFRYVDRLVTNEKVLLQVSSKITGKLKDGYCERIGDIIFGMLPAGSISGAPKKKTIEIIRSVEGKLRGYYTGIFGVFNGKNLDSAVMIRFIERNENGLWFRSGGGITHMSNVKLEYQELLDKVYVPIG